MMISNYLKQIEGLSKTAQKSADWLKNNKAVSDDADNALSGFNELMFAIPIFGGSGENYKSIEPWHHLFFEAEQDLDSAVLLLLTGFYKDSFRSLRSFLELHIFSLYHYANDDKDNFQVWLEGKANTPRMGDLLKTLSKKSEHIRTLNDKLQWNTEVDLLYKELSGFMHTQGASHTHTSLRSSNMTSFSEIGIDTGIKFLLKALRLASMAFTVNFPMSLHPLPLFEKFAFSPPAGGFLEEDQVHRIKNIFSNEISEVLSGICLSNEDANALAEGVKSMYDLSEEEIFESLKKVIESKEFVKSKPEIIQMIKDNQINKAFAYVQAMQRAMMRTVTMVLYNPFYEVLGRK
jgi:hypothetical protein